MAADKRYVPTWAQRFTDRVWAADPGELTPVEMLILLAYARSARRGDSAWLTQRALMNLCKIPTPAVVVMARRAVVKRGWLQAVGSRPVRGGRAVVYRLTMPESGSPGEPLSGPESGSTLESLSSESGSPGEPLSDESDSTVEPLESGSPGEPLSESGSPGESLTFASGSPGEPLYDVKRFSVHSKAIRLKRSSGSPGEPGFLDVAPPIGGVQAGAYAREDGPGAPTLRGAPENPPPNPSKNPTASSIREEAIRSMRAHLADQHTRKPKS